MSEPRITQAYITRDRYQNEVRADLDDGSTTVLFAYYPDELSFTEDEFKGLTEKQGRHLFFVKDQEYLRTP